MVNRTSESNIDSVADFLAESLAGLSQITSDWFGPQINADKFRSEKELSNMFLILICVYLRLPAAQNYSNTKPLRLIDDTQSVLRFFVDPCAIKSSINLSMQLRPSNPKKPWAP